MCSLCHVELWPPQLLAGTYATDATLEAVSLNTALESAAAAAAAAAVAVLQMNLPTHTIMVNG
jgi:hypothetical protein